MTILVVEDDLALSDVLAFTLRRAGFAVATAFDGLAALDQWRTVQPELIILDLNLPKLDGIGVCRQIRASATTPILILSVRGGDEAVVQGLEAGADDYVVKPFSPSQLVARVRALLRRAGNINPRLELTSGPLTLDRSRSELVTGQGTPVRLTALELRLLEALLLQAGQVLTADALIGAVWGIEGGDRTMLKQLVYRLRIKLDAEAPGAVQIEAVPGIGYALVAQVISANPLPTCYHPATALVTTCCYAGTDRRRVMQPFPTLDLHDLELEAQLVRRLPYGMAAYYHALPVAEDDGAVTVAMTHPENATAVGVIADLLHTQVVPVQGDESTIQAALRRFHPEVRPPENRVVAWGSDADHSSVLAAMATLCAERLAAQYVPASKLVGSLDAALALAGSLHARLAILGAADQPNLQQVLQQAGMPFLLVGGCYRRPSRILIVMRGYASDETCAAWVARLAEPGAAVTVLPVLEYSQIAATGVLAGNGHLQRHLIASLSPLNTGQCTTAITFRAGGAVAQIAAELTQSEYDLLVIPAEGHGVFVSAVWDELRRRKLHAERPVLIVRPQL